MVKEVMVTERLNFYLGNNPKELLEKYGSPLYVYNENILRERCREVRDMCAYKRFRVNYSAKANANLALLKIVRDEGLDADAMSPGEIFVETAAGFGPENIFYVSNNVSADEMRFAYERGIMISVDSVSQLETYCANFPHSSVAIRVNPGIGAGHHEKVVTAGENTKFAVNPADLPLCAAIAHRSGVRIAGINQHIGSHFMEFKEYIDAAYLTTEIAKNFAELDFIDLGGGFGIPYKKSENEERLDVKALGAAVDCVIADFTRDYGREIIFKAEPGRYISAECGVLLGTVQSVKMNGGTKYIGTDLGFNNLCRVMVYDAWHDIEIYTQNNALFAEGLEEATLTGNICESGDVLARNRLLPKARPGDIAAVLDAGAYGMSMASNYNNRLLPAEVLIEPDGKTRLIRERDCLSDLMRKFPA